MKDGESKVELRRAGSQGQQSLERFKRTCSSSFWCAVLRKVPDPVAHHHASRKMGGMCRRQYKRPTYSESGCGPGPAVGPSVRGTPQPVAVGGSSMPSYDKITENLERLSARIEALQARPPLVVGKLAHARNPSEVRQTPHSLDNSLWLLEVWL